jgi:hypothetical protein
MALPAAATGRESAGVKPSTEHRRTNERTVERALANVRAGNRIGRSTPDASRAYTKATHARRKIKLWTIASNHDARFLSHP